MDEGTLKGRLEPVEIVEELKPSVGLRPRGSQLPPIRSNGTDPQADEHRVRPDGTFEIHGLPEGAFDIVLLGEHSLCGMSRSGFQVGGVLATEELDEDGTTEVVLSVPHLRPARLRARIGVNGEDVPVGDVVLITSKWSQRIQAGANGSFEHTLPPGIYSVSATVGEEGTRCYSAGVELRGGECLDHVFQLIRQDLRVRVLLPDGSPAARRTLRVDSMRFGRRSFHLTDADGWLTLPTIPAPPLIVHLPADGMTWEAYDALPPDQQLQALLAARHSDYDLSAPPTDLELRLVRRQP